MLRNTACTSLRQHANAGVARLPGVESCSASLPQPCWRSTSPLLQGSTSPQAEPCRLTSTTASSRFLSRRQPRVSVSAVDPKDGNRGSATVQFNATYAVIFGVFAALFLFRSPYIFAALTILTIIPQNSAVTSLNSLVLLFYDSGLFMNFAEAVYCVRLVSWLSIACTLVSFAIFV